MSFSLSPTHFFSPLLPPTTCWLVTYQYNTMAFVGRLSNLFTSVQSFYNELNPATLSGAVDIVVVQQPDGELACSPFHVRFGKLSLLMPQEKKVSYSLKVDDSMCVWILYAMVLFAWIYSGLVQHLLHRPLHYNT